MATATYRVILGVVRWSGGEARPGDLIALEPEHGDPLCSGSVPVLERVTEPTPVLEGDFEGWQAGERPDDAPVGEQIDGQGLEPIAAPEPEPAPAPAPKPTRRRRAAAP